MRGPPAAQIFLGRLSPLIAAGKIAWQPRNRRKTYEFMLEEALRTEDALAIISDLRDEHFFQGPEPDIDGSPGVVMVFLYPYKRQASPRNEILLYIKVKIWTDTHGDAGIVMSFHDEGNYE